MSIKKIKLKPVKKNEKSVKSKSKNRKSSNSIHNWENSLHYKLARIAFENPDFRMDTL